MPQPLDHHNHSRKSLSKAFWVKITPMQSLCQHLFEKGGIFAQNFWILYKPFGSVWRHKPSTQAFMKIVTIYKYGKKTQNSRQNEHITHFFLTPKLDLSELEKIVLSFISGGPPAKTRLK